MQKYINLQQNMFSSNGAQKPFGYSWLAASRHMDCALTTEEGRSICSRLYLCSRTFSGGTLIKAA